MHRDKAISDTHEMYLKTLYSVRGSHDVAHVRDLAEGLGVSPATVSSVLKKLERLHLVEHERYGVVTLTRTGQQVAECVQRRYETLRDVLVEVFGVAPQVADIDACMMEHAVSPSTVNRMRAVLDNVRRGKAKFPRRGLRSVGEGSCSRCEAVGACQAGIGDE